MMDENDGPPWTPSSGLKKYLPGTDDLHLVGIEGLLDIAASPFKIKNVNTEYSGTGSPKSVKRPRAVPHSPGTALLIEAAKATEAGATPKFASRQLVRYMVDSPETSLLESGPLDFVSPPSPARTPSRLLFSPRTETRIMMRNQDMSSSPRTLLTPYETSASDKQSDELVGSIWKHAEEDKRVPSSSSARRPLLQQVMTFVDEDPDDEEMFVPLPPATPDPATPSSARRAARTPKSGGSAVRMDKRKLNSAEKTASERKKDKKDRKTYSTAGRPRQRGEYKCGKCGYYPKKEKHDCLKELANRSNSGSSTVTPSPLRKSVSRASPL
eukprot:m.437410 g.437410  ORF g.437410 m.437410 type:complete len:326 (+) comp18111_c0_seq1:85-1062(+)